MARILKGKAVADALFDAQSQTLAALGRRQITPTLAILRMGDSPDDVAYEASILRQADRWGVSVVVRALSRDASQTELEAALAELCADPKVHGILAFRPFPSQIDDERIRTLMDPEKDLDGITDLNMSRVYSGNPKGYAPCTAESVLAILRHYGIPMAGRRAVVLGRSLVIGKPVAMMLLGENATVTLCHRSTFDLAEECRRGDILVAAAGTAGLVDGSFLREGQVVLDVGIHVDEAGTMSGDVKAGEADAIVDALTPVPGGVGTVTTAILFCHLLRSAASGIPKGDL
jgi:methylenetetrahydrofolate dehydrogenase (NADP+)/methenyltetrahydrofolate cyclohydrolase